MLLLEVVWQIAEITHSTAANGRWDSGEVKDKNTNQPCLPDFLWFGIFTAHTLHNNEMQNSETGIIKKCFEKFIAEQREDKCYHSRHKSLEGTTWIICERRTYLNKYISKALFTSENLLHMNVRGNCRRSYISAL